MGLPGVTQPLPYNLVSYEWKIVISLTAIQGSFIAASLQLLGQLRFANIVGLCFNRWH